MAKFTWEMTILGCDVVRLHKSITRKFVPWVGLILKNLAEKDDLQVESILHDVNDDVFTVNLVFVKNPQTFAQLAPFGWSKNK